MANNSYTELNPGTGGSKMDETQLTVDGVAVHSPRVVVRGDEAAGELAAVKNADQGVSGTSYGIIARLVGKNPVVSHGSDGVENIGTTSDADSADTVIGRLKKLVSLITARLPGSLGAGGGVKIDGSGTALPVDGSGVTQPVSDAGGSLTVDGTVAVSSVGGTVAVSGPLTDTELRASAVSVSDGGGSLTVDGTVGVSGTVTVDGSGVTQPVSGTVTADLGAIGNVATETTLATLALESGGNLDAIAAALAGPLDVSAASLTVTGPLTNTELRASDVPVSVAALPLPPDAATATKQDTGNASLSSIDGKLPSGMAVSTGRLVVDGSGVTQPVSGTITANAGSGTFTVGDGGGSITVDGTVGVSGTVTVDGSGVTQPISGTVTIQDGGNTITVDGAVTANAGTGTFAVSAASLPLPSGAATEAKQDTGNTSLSSIDGKLPALVGSRVPVDGSGVTQPVSDAGGSLTVDDGGSSLTVDGTVAVSSVGGTVAVSGPLTDTQLRASAVPVSDGGSSLTVDGTVGISGTVTVDGSGVTQPVSAASLPLPSGAATSAKQDTGNSSLSSIDGKLPALVSSRVPVDGSGVTQPVSDGGGSLTVDGTIAVSSVGGTVAVSGPLTDTQLRAAAVPVSASSLPLPAGAATETTLSGLSSITSTLQLDSTGQDQLTALNSLVGEDFATETTLSSVNVQTSSIYNSMLDVIEDMGPGGPPSAFRVLSYVSGSAIDPRQVTLQAGSALVGKVGIDQTTPGTTNGVQVNAALPAGTNTIGAVTGPGAAALATAAKQDTGNTSLSNIDGKLPALVSSRVPVYATGGAASGAAVTGNPVLMGGSDGTNAQAIKTTTDGVVYVQPYPPPTVQVWKSYTTTTAAGGTAIWTPTSGKKIAITSIVIGSYGTTAARLWLWFSMTGASDATYDAGTDQAVVVASFAPSTSSKPGLVFTPPVPVFSTQADRPLRITTDANLSVDVTVYGYEV